MKIKCCLNNIEFIAFCIFTSMVCLLSCSKKLEIDEVASNTKNLLNAPYKANLVFLGTSLTYGQGTGAPLNQGWPGQLIALLQDSSAYHNFGIRGAIMRDIADNELGNALSVYDSVKYKINVAFVEGGTNDFANGVTGAAVYSAKKSVCQSLKAAGFKVVVVTSPAFNNAVYSKDGDPIAVEQARQDLLILERKGWKSDIGADGLIDWSADPIFGKYVGNGNQDLTYWLADGIHFNIIGYGLLAQKALPAIAALKLKQTYGTVTQPEDVTLQGLTANGSGVIVPSIFDPLINEYTLKLYGTVSSTTITPITNSNTATVKVNEVLVSSGSSVTQQLVLGNNFNYIRIENGLNSKIYQINAIRGSWDLVTSPLSFTSNYNLSQQPDGLGVTVVSIGYGVTTQTINGDGFLQFNRVISTGIALGMDLSGTLTSNKDNSGAYDWSYQIYIDRSAELFACKNNTFIDVGNETNNNGYFRLDRTAGIVTVQYSPDNLFYTTLYTFPGSSTGSLYAKVNIGDYGTKLYNLAGCGLK